MRKTFAALPLLKILRVPETLHLGSCINRGVAAATGATLLVKRDVLRQFPFDEDALRSTDTIFQLERRHVGMTTYASDEFNYCAMRRSGAAGHLWPIAKENITKNAFMLPVI